MRRRLVFYVFWCLLCLTCRSAHAGYWKIEAQFFGIATATLNKYPGPGQLEPLGIYAGVATQSTGQDAWLDAHMYPETSEVTNIGLSTLGTNTSTNGALQVSIRASAGIGCFSPYDWYPFGFAGTADNSLGNGKVRFTFTWITTDPILDPPPSGVWIKDLISIETEAGVTVTHITGASFTSSTAASCGDLVAPTSSASRTSGLGSSGDVLGPVSDPPNIEYLPATSGVAVVEYPFEWSIETAGNTNGAVETGADIATDSISVAECRFSFTVGLAQFDISRGVGSGVHGGFQAAGSDPSFTRWLPVEFSPVINSQPYRFASGNLPGPWGNINCAYSPTLRTDTNPDLDGFGLVVRGTPPFGNTGGFKPGLSFLDASGKKITFKSDYTPAPGVKSTLSKPGSYYLLSNAGPPWAMGSRGNYTYKFADLTSPGFGRLQWIEDPLGNRHDLAYNDSAPQFLVVTDNSSGRQIKFTKSGTYISEVVAPRLDTGATFVRTTTTMDGTGHLTQLKVYEGASMTATRTDTFTYIGDAIASQSKNGVLTYQTYQNGIATDPFGNAIPRLSTFALGSSGDTSSSDNGASIQGTWQYQYGWHGLGINNWQGNAFKQTTTDPRNNVFETQFKLSGGGQGGINSFTYKGPAYTGAASGTNVWKQEFAPDVTNPTSEAITDPFNKQWLFEYDGFGNPTSEADPLANEWNATYSTSGKELLTVTDPTNLTLTLNYGENSQPSFLLTSVLDPAGSKLFELTYNSFGQVTQEKVPFGVSASGQNEFTTYSYSNVTGDLLSVTNALGEISTVDLYDHLGDPLSFSVYPDTGDPATSLVALTSSITYDAAQMPVVMAFADGTSLHTTYNNGALNAFTVKQGATSLAQLNLSRDTRGRVYAMSDGVGSLGGFKYDRTGNLTRIIDGRGNSTQFTYGPNDEPIGVTWPGGASASGAYDKAGRLTSWTDERSQTINYGYDDAWRLTSAGDVTTTYDAADRPLVVSYTSGGTTFSYDLTLKRLQSVGTTIGSQTYQVSYTYFPDGQIASMTSPVGTTSYAYDKLGRVASITDPFGHVTTWSWDKAGRVTAQSTSPNGGVAISTAYTWGISGIVGDPSFAPSYLRKVTQSVNGLTLWDYTLKHSYLGQLTSQSGVGPSGDSETVTYGYDGRGRLTSNSQSHTISGTGYSYSASPTYDLANNVNGGASGWTYDTRNRVTAAASLNGLPGASGISYDASGNLTAAAGMTLSYNVWGQLTSVAGTPQGTVTFAYDHEGKRISKTVGGVTTHFLYDGELLIAELNAATGAVKRSYTWGPLGVISDRDHVAGTSRFYLYDKSGNVRSLVGASGTVLSRGAYTPYGSPVSAAVLPSTPLAWNGRAGCYRDDETGLILAGARYYAPALGRFIQPDPSGFAGGINSLYGYCAGDPVNLFDADGLSGESVMDWYMGGMGGLSNAVDDSFLFGGSTKHFGDTFGRYEMGKASPWELYQAANRWSEDLGNAGLMIYGGGKAVAGGLRRGLGAFRKGGCFVAGTLIPVVDQDGTISYKAIEKIKEGDLVLSRNSRTGENSVQTVDQTTIRQVDEVLTLHFVDSFLGQALEPITTTAEHPFYALGKGFVEAGQLGIGTEIVTRAGPTARLSRVEVKSQPTTVYNLTVAQDHTYFVSENLGGIWVHNNELCTPKVKEIDPKKIKSPPSGEGKAPTGEDDFPVEIHHGEEGLEEMTRTDHRLGGNYAKNHPKGRGPEVVDRRAFDIFRKKHWAKRFPRLRIK